MNNTARKNMDPVAQALLELHAIKNKRSPEFRGKAVAIAMMPGAPKAYRLAPAMGVTGPTLYSWLKSVKGQLKGPSQEPKARKALAQVRSRGRPPKFRGNLVILFGDKPVQPKHLERLRDMGGEVQVTIPRMNLTAKVIAKIERSGLQVVQEA